MVFSSYSNTSYLPLDSDQGVAFYKNENSLFPPPSSTAAAATAAVVASSPSTLVCRRNQAAAAAAMLTASTGNSPFGSQPLHHGSLGHGNVCDDFQPVAHLSSNGYYGYVPTNSIPKMMSTAEGTPPTAAAAPSVPVAVNGNGVSVLLDCHPAAVAASDSSNSSSMMDCGEVENYHQLQQQQQQQLQQHLRKRKEYSEEMEVNCKRRKTWLEPSNDAGKHAVSECMAWNRYTFVHFKAGWCTTNTRTAAALEVVDVGISNAPPTVYCTIFRALALA